MKKFFFFLCALVCSAAMSADETVYFVNAQGYTGDISCYAWKTGATDQNAKWPGVAMVKEDYQLKDVDVYSYTAADGVYEKCIFNGTGGQTDNLAWIAGKYYYKDGWYTRAELEGGVLPQQPKDTIFFVNKDNWSKVYFYAWNGLSVGGWPGIEMTKADYQLKAADVYYYTAPLGSSCECKFTNNEGTETGNTQWTAGKYYYNDTWMTRAELEGDEPIDPTTKYYVTGNEDLVGSDGKWNVTAIELTYTDGIYTHTFSNVVAGKECQLKITDGTWNSTWGYSNLTVIPSGVTTNKDNNIIFTLSAAGDVTVQFDATKKKITLIGVSDTPAEDTYGIGSNLNNWTPTADPMTVADGVAKCTINLTSTEDFKFAVVKNGKWLKNVDAPITRENNTLALSEIDSWENCTLTPDKEGEYVFTFTIANSTLVVTYPLKDPTSISSTETEVVTTKVIRDGQVLIIRDGVVYNMMGQAIR